jgi:hypothetical protein
VNKNVCKEDAEKLNYAMFSQEVTTWTCGGILATVG